MIYSTFTKGHCDANIKEDAGFCRRQTLLSSQLTLCSPRFLCGKNAVIGQSFAHQRQCIEDRLPEEATGFAIDLCSYALMHNHYTVISFIDKSKADNWDALKVVMRWHLLFSGALYSQRITYVKFFTASEQASIDASLALWHEHLMDISWFKKIINEGIACMANREDDQE